MAQRVLLDACVLFPSLVRGVLVEIAGRGLFVPHWSPRILDEWRIAVVRQNGIAVEPDVVAAQALMAERFPDAEVPVPSEVEAALDLPDAADHHVLAAAIGANVDVLMTFNLRDFPQRAASVHGIEIVHPDGFLWQLLSEAPVEVSQAVSAAFDAAGIAQQDQRKVLKRARLSRFGKALEALRMI